MKIITGLLLLLALFPGAATSKQDSSGDHIIVVGAGIVGASIAYHLSLEGKSVTVLERTEPASHATRGTFAWLNASWAKQPYHYHQLNQQSVDYWHKLSKELDIPVKWGGSLEWFTVASRTKTLISQIEEQQKWGEPAEMLTTETAQALEANVLFPKDTLIAYSKNDGAVDPQLATKLLLKAAEKNGVTIRYPCNVTSIDAKQYPVSVETSCGIFTASKLVLAVGANSQIIQQTTGIDIPQRSTPGIIAVTEPMPKLIDRIIVAPGVHIHQRLDGRVVIGEQAGAPKTHEQRLANRPNEYPSALFEQQHYQRMLDIAVTVVPGLEGAKLEDIFIGWRPLPLDGHPVLGFSDTTKSIYIAVMHSGITLAPIVGKLVTQELTGAVVPEFEKYRPQRSFEMIKRY